MIKFSHDNFTIKEADKMTIQEINYYYSEFGAVLERAKGHFILLIPIYDYIGFAKKMEKLTKTIDKSEDIWYNNSVTTDQDNSDWSNNIKVYKGEKNKMEKMVKITKEEFATMKVADVNAIVSLYNKAVAENEKLTKKMETEIARRDAKIEKLTAPKAAPAPKKAVKKSVKKAK